MAERQKADRSADQSKDAARPALALAEVPGDIKVEQLVSDGDPGDEILAQAERLAADLIVIGSRGLGAYAELLLGSVSRKVLHLAKVPVMVVRG